MNEKSKAGFAGMVLDESETTIQEATFSADLRCRMHSCLPDTRRPADLCDQNDFTPAHDAGGIRRLSAKQRCDPGRPSLFASARSFTRQCRR